MFDAQTIIFLSILLISIIAFVKDWFPIEVTSLLVLAALIVTGLIDTDQAVSGFSNKAVITIGAMFILSHAFTKTGFISVFTVWLENNGRGRNWAVTILFLLSVSIFSAFINNTATVAILIPAAKELAKKLKISASKIMMPLSYAAIVGGTCTIIGTSTNLIVNELASDAGFSINVFELSKLGIILVVVTILYSLVAQKWLIPSRLPVSSLTKKYHMGTYLTEVVITEESPLLGKNIIETGIGQLYELTVLEILRRGNPISTNLRNIKLKQDDVLLVQCTVEKLQLFKNEQKVSLLTDIKMDDKEIANSENILKEAMVSPNSRLSGRSLMDSDFRRRYGLFVLAVRSYRETLKEKIAHIRLRPFDTLLIFGSRTRMAALHTDPNFIMLDELDLSLHKIRFWWLVVALIPAIVLVAALNITSIMTASLLGAILVMALGIVPAQEAYKAINWTVIFLIAAFIPIADAMHNIGLAQKIEHLIALSDSFIGDVGLLAVLFFFTMFMTSFLSNTATAIIMAPLAIESARILDLSPIPFIMTIMFSASLSFMTPNGYQTNTMVMTPGGYRYTDFLKVGIPLHIILGTISVLLIPVFWPLHP
ncbi:MAG: SLC13 family permease [Candidatus Marinimicrobia bacterium]|nr:SLC13 family permease [Candidatus Neomarinimicrobiota bacterium]MCF7904954.1 SLC13 family permease [Candidatus Neomarinimicrobiota bacterium]